MKKIFKWVMSIGVVGTSIASVVSCSTSSVKKQKEEKQNSQDILGDAFNKFNSYDYQKMLAGDTSTWHDNTKTLDLDLGAIFHLSKQTPLVSGKVNTDPINKLFRDQFGLRADASIDNILESYITTPYLTYSLFEKARNGDSLATPGLYHIQPDTKNSLLTTSKFDPEWNTHFRGTDPNKGKRVFNSIKLFAEESQENNEVHNGIIMKFTESELENNDDVFGTGGWVDEYGWEWSEDNWDIYNAYRSIAIVENWQGDNSLMDHNNFIFGYYKYASDYNFNNPDTGEFTESDINSVVQNKDKPLDHPGFYIFPPNEKDGSLNIEKLSHIGYKEFDEEGIKNNYVKFHLDKNENAFPSANNSGSRLKYTNNKLTLDLSQTSKNNKKIKRIYTLNLKNDNFTGPISAIDEMKNKWKSDVQVHKINLPALMFFKNVDYLMKVIKTQNDIKASLPLQATGQKSIFSPDFLQYIEVGNLALRNFSRSFMSNYGPSTLNIGDKTLYYQDHFGGEYDKVNRKGEARLPFDKLIKADSFKTTTVEDIYLTDQKNVLNTGAFGKFDGYVEKLLQERNPYSVLWNDKITYHHNNNTYKYFAKYKNSDTIIEFPLRGFFKNQPANRDEALKALTHTWEEKNSEEAFSSDFHKWKVGYNRRVYNYPEKITNDSIDVDFISAQNFDAGNGYTSHTLPTLSSHQNQPIFQESKGFTASPVIVYDETNSGTLASYVSQFATSIEYKTSDNSSSVKYYHKSFFDLDINGHQLKNDVSNKLKYSLPKPLIGFYKEGTKLSYKEYMEAYKNKELETYILKHLNGDDVSRLIIPGDYSGSDFIPTSEQPEPTFFEYNGHIIRSSSVQNMILHTNWELSIRENISGQIYSKTVPNWNTKLPQDVSDSINSSPFIESPSSHDIIQDSTAMSCFFQIFSKKDENAKWPDKLSSFNLQFKFGSVNLGNSIPIKEKRFSNFLFNLMRHRYDVLISDNFATVIKILEKEDFSSPGLTSFNIFLQKPEGDNYEHSVGYLLAQELKKFINYDVLSEGNKNE